MYKRQIGVSRLLHTLTRLERQVGTDDEICCTTVKIAKIFYQSKDIREVHLAAARILVRLQRQPATSNVTKQAKLLVVANELAKKGNTAKAKKSYLRVVKVDESSKAGRYAQRQIDQLR